MFWTRQLIRIIKFLVKKDRVKMLLISLQLENLLVEVSNQRFLSFFIFLNFWLELLLDLNIVLYFELKESNLAGHFLYQGLLGLYFKVSFGQVLMIYVLLAMEHVIDHFEFIYPLGMKAAFLLLMAFFNPIEGFSWFGEDLFRLTD